MSILQALLLSLLNEDCLEHSNIADKFEIEYPEAPVSRREVLSALQYLEKKGMIDTERGAQNKSALTERGLKWKKFLEESSVPQKLGFKKTRMFSGDEIRGVKRLLRIEEKNVDFKKSQFLATLRNPKKALERLECLGLVKNREDKIEPVVERCREFLELKPQEV